MPGHIFPLRAKNGGVLVRTAIAEASVDLLTIADVGETAALCHCLGSSGESLSKDELDKLVSNKELSAVNISDIVKHRLSSETLVEKISEAKLPIKNAGEFRALCFPLSSRQC